MSEKIKELKRLVEDEVKDTIYKYDQEFDLPGCIECYFNILSYNHDTKTPIRVLKHQKQKNIDEITAKINKREKEIEFEEDIIVVNELEKLKIQKEKVEEDFEKKYSFRDDISDFNFSSIKLLKQILIDDNYENVTDFNVYFEYFMKKIYYVLEENEKFSIENTVNPHTANSVSPYIQKIRACSKNIIKLYPSSLNLNKENENLKIGIRNKKNPSEILKKYNHNNKDCKNPFLYDFIMAFFLRNKISHEKAKLNKQQRLQYFFNTLIAKLYVINYVKNELEDCIDNKIISDKDFGVYIEKEKDRYENNIKKYVSLDFEEFGTKENLIISNIDDILKTDGYNQIRIIGKAGYGKTTTLEYLVYNDLTNYNKDKIVPVLVSLASIPNNKSLIEFITTKIYQVAVDDCIELMKKNKIKIYLDGLSEINNSRKKNEIMNEINDVRDKFPNVVLVITDRIETDVVTNRYFKNIREFKVMKLDESKIKEFVKKYCSDDEETALRINETLTERGFKKFIKVPLILTSAIQILQNYSDLPDRPGQIVEKFIEILLEREKNDKND